MNILMILLFLVCIILSAGKTGAATTDELIVNLHSHNEQVQMAAVEELGKIKDRRVVDELLDFVFIEAENWRIKIRAIRLLGDIADPNVSDRLVTIFNNPFLNETCPAMKWNTAIALGKNFNKGSRAVDSLIDALHYNDLLVREATIQSLGKIGDAKAVPFIIPALNDKSFAIKFSAIKALENLGDPQAIPFLKKIADTDRDPYIRGAALSALQNFRHD